MKKREPLEDREILEIIATQLSDANTSSFNINNLRLPLEYYLGLPNGTEVEGRSTIVSTDVADAIEWIMPQIMKSFTQTNEVVIFDPVNGGDVFQAELESQYVYDVLMKQNNGFVLIHQFVKDALMQRNGILKVYYEEYEETKIEKYSGLLDEQLQMLVADKGVEILEHSVESYFNQGSGQFFDAHSVTLEVKNMGGRICIDPVPPENFRVNSQHNSVSLKNARFTAHIEVKTASELYEEGYDLDIIKDLPSADLLQSSYRFGDQGENIFIPSDFSNDPSSKLVDIAECYLKLDIEGNNVAELRKITVGGLTTDGGNPTVILSNEQVEDDPWIATTAILMSHKFQGLSIYDRLKQIQDNKTAIIRSINDNMYLQNNQRMVVLENAVNLDDLLISRPGGLVRVKRMDAIQPLITAPFNDVSFSMLKYLDEIRAGRVGVSAEGSATPQNIGDRVGSQGVNRMMDSKEELVGLIIRVICETGIKPLCIKIRDLLTAHVDAIQDYQFRGQWIQVNPSSWIKRTDCTVRVGTGTGDKREKLAAINQIGIIQKDIFSIPGQALVTPLKMYATLDDFCKFAGLNGASKYFVDPSSTEGQQATQQAHQQSQQDQQKIDSQTVSQLQLEAKIAEAAVITAQSEQENVRLKGLVEGFKHKREVEELTFKAQIENLKAQLEQSKFEASTAKTASDIEFNYDKMIADVSLKLVEIEAKTKSDQGANFLASREIMEASIPNE